ncbi:hypothetical protein [Novosphingobium sp. BL-52-GroH]|uniref:hypothetical protein n=1 Tax=Novosphingobium sp. BL-52-GroH TaxID=3349877 RepID=UPI0038517028
MCEPHCTSDAIYVGPDQHEIEVIDPDAIRASGHLELLGPLLQKGSKTAARRQDALLRAALGSDAR